MLLPQEVIRIGRADNKIESKAFITVHSVISIVKYVSSVAGEDPPHRE